MIGVFVQINEDSPKADTYPLGYVITESGCWEWVGSRLKSHCQEYGKLGKPQQMAHRFMYEREVGPIPDGLTLDHLCRNTLCVNPAHLEPVTLRENILRGRSPSALAAGKTHCVNGHEFTLQNTHTRSNGARECRQCMRDRYYRYKHKRGEACQSQQVM